MNSFGKMFQFFLQMSSISIAFASILFCLLTFSIENGETRQIPWLVSHNEYNFGSSMTNLVKFIYDFSLFQEQIYVTNPALENGSDFYRRRITDGGIQFLGPFTIQEIGDIEREIRKVIDLDKSMRKILCNWLNSKNLN